MYQLGRWSHCTEISYFVRLLRMAHDTLVTDDECLFATERCLVYGMSHSVHSFVVWGSLLVNPPPPPHTCVIQYTRKQYGPSLNNLVLYIAAFRAPFSSYLRFWSGCLPIVMGFLFIAPKLGKCLQNVTLLIYLLCCYSQMLNSWTLPRKTLITLTHNKIILS
jgi:hypothetical protein